MSRLPVALVVAALAIASCASDGANVTTGSTTTIVRIESTTTTRPGELPQPAGETTTVFTGEVDGCAMFGWDLCIQPLLDEAGLGSVRADAAGRLAGTVSSDAERERAIEVAAGAVDFDGRVPPDAEVTILVDPDDRCATEPLWCAEWVIDEMFGPEPVADITVEFARDRVRPLGQLTSQSRVSHVLRTMEAVVGAERVDGSGLTVA